MVCFAKTGKRVPVKTMNLLHSSRAFINFEKRTYHGILTVFNRFNKKLGQACLLDVNEEGIVRQMNGTSPFFDGNSQLFNPRLVSFIFSPFFIFNALTAKKCAFNAHFLKYTLNYYTKRLNYWLLLSKQMFCSTRERYTDKHEGKMNKLIKNSKINLFFLNTKKVKKNMMNKQNLNY